MIQMDEVKKKHCYSKDLQEIVFYMFRIKKPKFCILNRWKIL